MAEQSSGFLDMGFSAIKKKQTPKYINILIIIVLFLCVCWGGWYFYSKSKLFYDASLEGQIIEITAAADAQIVALDASLDKLVRQGEGLMVLKLLSGDQNLDLAALKESLHIIYQRLKEYEKQEKSAQGEVEQASLGHSKILLALRGNAKIEKREHERLQSEELNAKTRLELAKQRFEVISLERVAVMENYRQAKDIIQRGAKLGVATPPVNLTIVSPLNGRIVALEAALGKEFKKGDKLLTINPILTEQMWINAWADKSRLSEIKVGEACRIDFAETDLRLNGQIAKISGQDGDRVQVQITILDYDPLTMPSLTMGEAVNIKLLK